MSNRQTNQHFGTLDLIMLVVLCGTVSSVVGASVAGLLHDDRPSRARTSAESLAYQIRQQHDGALPVLAQQPVQGRAPASISDLASDSVPPLTDGQIGKDPWGHPYYYTVLGKPTEPNTTIVVWSAGPNGRVDSKIDELTELSTLNGPNKFHFKADDVGFIADGKSAH